MFWCLECDTAISEGEAVRENSYILHSEIDTGSYEKETNYYCPVCGKELWLAADRCACGNFKPANKDWCPQCLSIRDERMKEAFIRIRIDTRLNLETEDAKDLMMSYFE